MALGEYLMSMMDMKMNMIYEFNQSTYDECTPQGRQDIPYRRQVYLIKVLPEHSH